MTFALADRVYIATVPRPQGARWLPSLLLVGAWRSLVAHLPGGQGVAGSNPVAPTTLSLPEHASPSDALAGNRPSGRADPAS